MVILLTITPQEETWADVNYNRILARVSEMMVGIKDMAGAPYLEHLLYVSSRQGTASGRIVALLHDAIEDDFVTAAQLWQMWDIPGSIIQRIELLTKTKDMSYEEYVAKVCQDPVARRVKMIDLEHNMQVGRLYRKGPLTSNDVKRLNKYIAARQYVEDCEEAAKPIGLR